MNSNCSICHEPFQPEIAMVTTLCGHIFHFSCISNWLEQCGVNGSCPECRRKVDKRSLITLFFNWDDNNVEEELKKQLHERYFEIYDKNKKIQELQASNDLLKRSLTQLNKDLEDSQKDMASLRDLNRFALSCKEDCERKIKILLDNRRQNCEDIENLQTVCAHLQEENKKLQENKEGFSEEILTIKRENEKLGRIKAEYEKLSQNNNGVEFTLEYINNIKKMILSNADEIKRILREINERPTSVEEKLTEIALYCAEMNRVNSTLMEQKAHLQDMSAVLR
ncbi:E3 ubiquitin-protein ligase TRAIP-like [Argiope bruennichi]|uniref:E3 ubiquitin-protein ligase TRAIP-like n=1 Tax=Argiope bruennichi TaxID=94029 RepID=UPI002495337B|nr:E3 ubiquitin-protein ligase TRAIP-like [Argiope bruennichi]